MKTIVLSLVFAFLAIGIYAQEFEVPQNYKLEKDSDFANYEQDVLNCVNWLIKTPINSEKDKRKEANAFLLKWLTGSPDVSIEIDPNIVTFMNDSPEYLMIFMGAWAKYSIESGKYDDKVGGNLAGIEAVIEFYNANRKYVSKSKNIEKYIKMKEKGNLEKYIEKKA